MKPVPLDEAFAADAWPSVQMMELVFRTAVNKGVLTEAKVLKILQVVSGELEPRTVAAIAEDSVQSRTWAAVYPLMRDWLHRDE